MGTVFTRRQLWLMAVSSLSLAYLLAIYYMVRFVPLLWFFALAEGFFVFAYNLELFQGRFHTDPWFAFSWGFLPVLAGYVMQTNHISRRHSCWPGLWHFSAWSRLKHPAPTSTSKRLINTLQNGEKAAMMRYESILKSISLGVILLGAGLLVWRILDKI